MATTSLSYIKFIFNIYEQYFTFTKEINWIELDESTSEVKKIGEKSQEKENNEKKRGKKLHEKSY